MILPTKYLREDETLIGLGAVLLSNLTSEKTLSDLWEFAKKHPNIGNFERFILALDMLFIFGLIIARDNKIMRVKS